MMHALKTLTTLHGLVATVMAVAIPQGPDDTPTTGGVEPVVPTAVDIMYYQGPWEPNGQSCGTPVSNGTLEANTCTPLCTIGISVLQIPEADCLLTVYQGTKTCTRPSEVVSYAIGKGDGGMVCIDVGVVDGCGASSITSRGGASGVWSCG